jgi:hypothetical protein
MIVVKVNRISSRSELPARNIFLAEDVSTDFDELDSACLCVQAKIDTFRKDVNRSQKEIIETMHKR